MSNEYSNLQGLSRNVLLAVLVPYTIFFIPIKMLSIFISPVFKIVCMIKFNMFTKRKVTEFWDEFLYMSNEEPRSRSVFRQLFDVFGKPRMQFLNSGWQIAYMHQNKYQEGHVFTFRLFSGYYDKAYEMMRWCYNEFETLDQFCFYTRTRSVGQGGAEISEIVFMIKDYEQAIKFKLIFGEE